MVLKPLPKSLVKRVSNAVSKKFSPGDIYSFLGRANLIDHRKGTLSKRGISRKSTAEWGTRVREIDVSRNFPSVGKVVVKRVHSCSGSPLLARTTIEKVKKDVQRHNRSYNPKNYRLLYPRAYEVGTDLVLMSKTKFPSVTEILGSAQDEPTRRGKSFFKGLAKTQRVNESVFHNELLEAAKQVSSRTNIDLYNLLLVGYEKRQFVFVPLVDLF